MFVFSKCKFWKNAIFIILYSNFCFQEPNLSHFAFHLKVCFLKQIFSLVLIVIWHSLKKLKRTVWQFQNQKVKYLMTKTSRTWFSVINNSFITLQQSKLSQFAE